ncbi:response regulator transcription factor [Flavobacterium sp. '19STA2R22 D10 B1']|uniref:response regulator transcription factor n=1 Tax=Flavobacterium aerium TaxID=3037261 RepID=UPI00278BB231|nr:response regulator transcription factor [Flavobacterium sp. '19STA2R22 D10 B1']
MIKVCLADNHPVVEYGVKSYFKENSDINIVSFASSYDILVEILKKRIVDVLVLDLDLEGLTSINLVKSLLKEHPNTKIAIYTNQSEQIYAPNALKAGVSAFIHKTEKLDTLYNAIVKVSEGEIIFSDTVKKNLALIGKRNKNNRLYRKLSTREIEVLRYLSDGKKNKEIAKILDLNEKTVSTYKLRLLTKLHVTNLVDLVNKAKTLEIV